MKQDKFAEAIDCYMKAIELDSNNAVYYCNRYERLYIFKGIPFIKTSENDLRNKFDQTIQK